MAEFFGDRMNIIDVKNYQAQKDHLMRFEGKHPANYDLKDHVNASRDQQMNRGFVEHDGDYGNKHLDIVVGSPNSKDRMPVIADSYASDAKEHKI
jgi:hypothetical protein